LIGRGLGGIATWRDLVLQATCGALLATPLAFIIEVIIVLLVTVGAILGLAWQPNGLNLLQRIATQLQDPAWFQDLGTLESLVLTPAVMLAAFAIVSGIIPTIEEAVKTIGVGIAAHRRPSLPQAVFWGSAAGAGFAITEGLLNATVDLGGWLPVVVLRIGTTLLHCTTGAFMGLAWYQALALRRRSRAITLYLLSVVVHGLWNGLALGVTLLSFKALDADLAGTDQAMAGLTTLVVLVLYGIVALGMAGGLAILTIRARRQHLASATVREQVVPVPQEAITLEDRGPED
jgi:RsiW-degrading membrane proteinase PrsW (M82 family)